MNKQKKLEKILSNEGKTLPKGITVVWDDSTKNNFVFNYKGGVLDVSVTKENKVLVYYSYTFYDDPSWEPLRTTSSTLHKQLTDEIKRYNKTP